MNITTIIELENNEVESITGAQIIFVQEKIDENIIETCVECFQVKDSEARLSTEEAMQKVFDQLKTEGVIPHRVEDFSFEMPSCERIKSKTKDMEDFPQKVVLSYMS
jgi:Na+-translocating ferredoxin:NAD+ oxidoreductase RNF subunit RnfB